MEWLNHFAPAVQATTAAVIVLLTASLVGVTLRYAASTRRIAQASVEQSEALQKPFVTVESAPRNAEGGTIDRSKAAVIAQRSTVVLYNLGVGPALNVFYCFKQLHQPEGVYPLDLSELVPSMRPRQKWATRLPVTSLDNRKVEFRATYRSLSGTEYETKMTLESRVITSFHFGPCG
jgi:hypothetical protein